MAYPTSLETLYTFPCDQLDYIILTKSRERKNKLMPQKYLIKHSEKASKLAFHREFLQPLQKEHQNVTWNSYIYVVSRG
jgi:hypothetical protein